MTTARPTLPKLLANKSADELRKLLIYLAKSRKDTREAIFEYYGQYQSPEEFESSFKKQNKQKFLHLFAHDGRVLRRFCQSQKNFAKI